MRRRLKLVREAASVKKDSGGSRRETRDAEPYAPDTGSEPRDRSGPDPVERFAQDGFGALERFGAELEAIFMGPAPRRAQASAEPSVSGSDDVQPAPRVPLPAGLSEVETELNRVLMEEGIVVRGHDVARVVGLMAGKDVPWPS
jgi:hypothetical protein